MSEQSLSKQTKMAMISQFLGFGLDAYDMAMVIVMAPILGKIFISPKGSALWQYIAIVLGYSITMAARPIGSAFFGAYADKIGRRFLLIFTIGGVGVMSLLSGFLPTYAQGRRWSLCSVLCAALLHGLLLRRRVCRRAHLRHRVCSADSGAAPSAVSFSRASPWAMCLASLVFAAISATCRQVDSDPLWLAHRVYDWRCPRFLAFWIRGNLQESPEFEKTKAAGKIIKAPFLSLFMPPQLWDFLQVFVFMAGLFLTDYSVYGFLPKILTLGGRGFDTTL